jgi:rSAM/selenodomain-associated transferase 1
VKTRLIPAVGAEGAALLHRRMTVTAVDRSRKVLNYLPVTIAVHFDGDNYQQMSDWLGTDLVYHSQGTGDVGARMARSFATACQHNSAVILIGTDCPELTTDILNQAFDLLQSGRDLVLGAAIDGGYYLIGMREYHPELFVDIDWSTDRVLQQTVAIANRLNLALGYLPTLTDIDRPADLPILTQNIPEAKISIVIPALNEAANIERVLAEIHPLPNVEIILVDGGSSDDTIKIATELGIRVLSSSKGRAHQMNVGAKATTGEILLFLHADTFLPSGFDRMVRSTLQPPLGGWGAVSIDISVETSEIGESPNPLKKGAKIPIFDSGIYAYLVKNPDCFLAPFLRGFGGFTSQNEVQQIPIAGAFTLKIDDSMASLRWIEKMVAWRSKWRQMPYGDQAIFLTAETFRSLGGFVEMPIMEDFELIKRLQRRGRIEILTAPVLTSPRRWLQRGVWQTTLINQAIIIGYSIGISPIRLATWYRYRSSLFKKRDS